MLVKPTEKQLEWQELEFIAFIHFTVNTFTNREWGEGDEDPSIFDPKEFDAEQWVQVCKDAGMKLIILTAKHHDGFCLWPSRYTDHSVKHSPWKDGEGDIVREVADACRRAGLKFGIYLSPWDRHELSYGDSPRYNRHFKNQLEELLTGYGEISEVWFDGACGEGPNGKRQEYDWAGYYEVVRKYQPGAVIAICGPDIRWVGNETGVARETEWSVQPANEVFHGHNEKVWWPAECDVSIRPGWFYHPEEDDKVKTLEQLVDIYFKSVGRNSVLLLNIPPDRRGLIHEADIARLRELRTYLDDTFKDDPAAGKGAIDGNQAAYWSPKDGAVTGSLVIDLGAPATFDVVMVQEYIKEGQRVEEYTVEYWDGKGWQPLCEGTTIGYKKLDRCERVTSSRVRLNIVKALAPPLISNLGLYKRPLVF